MGKSVFILSTIKLYSGNSAGSSRMMNVAKALALAGCKVYLCSSKLSLSLDKEHMREVNPGIFVVGEEYVGRRSVPYRIANRYFHLFLMLRYLSRILSTVRNIEGEKAFYVYPQPEVSMDIASLIFVKYIHSFKIYADINELRTSSLSNDRRFFVGRRTYMMAKFKLSEYLVSFYDGIVAISTRLEEYFSRYNHNIIRVPILCGDVEPRRQSITPFAHGDRFKLCFAGEIRLDKEGFGDLYQSIAKVRKKHRDIELHLYGPVLKEQEKMILHELPSALNIADAIYYHGVVDQSTLAGEVCQYHLLLLLRPKTRQAQFGFSTKLGEYLVSGVPVLTTDSSDISLFLKDGENGFVVTTTDPEVVADKILDIISRYKEEAGAIAVRAQRTAMDSFHFAKYSQTLYNFLAA